MSKFTDLLPGAIFGAVGAEQEHAARRLPYALRVSNLCWWPDRPETPAHGRALVVGIAPYSREDLLLLDALDEALDAAPANRPRVQVFSVLDCRNNRDTDRFIPGLGAFFQTPLVGVWEDGELRAKAWGKQARDLVWEEVLGLRAQGAGRAAPGAPALQLSGEDAASLSHLPGYVVYGLTQCAPEVVSNPVAVYRGLKRGDSAPGRLRNGWAFSGKPSHAYDNAGEPFPSPEGMAFVVYANAEGYVFDWDWVQEDSCFPGVPADADLRFEDKARTERSSFTPPANIRAGTFDRRKPAFSPKGDCLFCYLNDEPAYGTRINEDLTVFYALANRDRITGFKIKNVQRIMREEEKLDLRDAPGLRVLVLPVLRKLRHDQKEVTYKLLELIVGAFVDVEVPVQPLPPDDCEVVASRC